MDRWKLKLPGYFFFHSCLPEQSFFLQMTDFCFICTVQELTKHTECIKVTWSWVLSEGYWTSAATTTAGRRELWDKQPLHCRNLVTEPSSGFQIALYPTWKRIKSSPYLCAYNGGYAATCLDHISPHLTTVCHPPVKLLSEMAFRDVRLWTTSRESVLSDTDGWHPAHWQKHVFAAEARLSLLRAAKRSHSSITRRNTPKRRSQIWSNCY